MSPAFSPMGALHRCRARGPGSDGRDEKQCCLAALTFGDQQCSSAASDVSRTSAKIVAKPARRPHPASLGIGSRAVRCGPSTPGHSHLDHPASACRNAAIRAIGGARDGSPQLSYPRLAPHGSLPSLVSAEAAPGSYEPLGRSLGTQLSHGSCGHVQRRARW